MYQIIKVPSSLGAPRWDSGMENGPNVLAEILLHENYSNLDSSVHSVEIPTPDCSHQIEPYEKAKNLPEIKRICCHLSQQVSVVIETGLKPLILMGDDSPTIGAVYGILKKIPNIAAIWFDAHGDLNTPETSPSGCFYGMGLAHALGYGHEEILSLNETRQFLDIDNVILVGPRDLDKGEIAFIEQHGLIAYPPSAFKKGLEGIMTQVGMKLRQNRTQALFLHYDLDAIDPKENPGVFGTASNGLSIEALYQMTEYLQSNFPIAGVSIANYIPEKDKDNKGQLLVKGLIRRLLN